METSSTAIAEYSKVEAALTMLREKYAGAIFEVATTDGMKLAKEARGEVRGYRTGLEKMRRQIKAPALEHCRLIDAEATRITVELVELEDPIKNQIKTHEDAKEAERQEKIDAETKRVEDIQARIEELRRATGSDFYTLNSDLIMEHISDFEAIAVDESFGEFEQQAQDAKAATLARMREMHDAAIRRETEAAKIKTDREELDKLREADDKRIAKEREEREAEERKERKRLQAEAAEDLKKLAELRKEQAAAQKKIDDENQRLADEQTARDAEAAAENKREQKAEADAKRAKFPGVEAITDALCQHFDVSADVVAKWLKVLK